MKKSWSITDYKIALNELKIKHKTALADLNDTKKDLKKYREAFSHNIQQLSLIDSATTGSIAIKLIDALNGNPNIFEVIDKKRIEYFDVNQTHLKNIIKIHEDNHKYFEYMMWKIWDRLMELHTEYQSMLLGEPILKRGKKRIRNQKEYFTKRQKDIAEYEKLIIAWVRYFNDSRNVGSSPNNKYLSKHSNITEPTLTRRFQDKAWLNGLISIIEAIQREKYTFETVKNKQFNENEVINLGHFLATIRLTQLKIAKTDTVQNYNYRQINNSENIEVYSTDLDEASSNYDSDTIFDGLEKDIDLTDK